MAITNLPKIVQYVTDSEGRCAGVLLDIRTWDSLVDWIEHATDSRIAVEALTEPPSSSACRWRGEHGGQNE